MGKITEGQRVEMVRRYADGETLAAIGDSMGVTKATIRHHLMAQGVAMRPNGRRPALSKAERARLIKMRDSTCLTARELAAKFGISVAALYRAVNGQYIERKEEV